MEYFSFFLFAMVLWLGHGLTNAERRIRELEKQLVNIKQEDVEDNDIKIDNMLIEDQLLRFRIGRLEKITSPLSNNELEEFARKAYEWMKK